MTDFEKLLIEGLVNIAKLTNVLILAGVSASFFLICARALGRDEVEMLGFKAPMRFFPAFVAFLTVSHGFVTWVFVRQASQIQVLELDVRQLAWESVKSKAGLLFYQTQDRWDDSSGEVTFYLSLDDPTAVLTLAFILLSCVAVILSTHPNIRIEEFRGSSIYYWMTFAGIISMMNWLIGSQWVIALSALLH